MTALGSRRVSVDASETVAVPEVLRGGRVVVLTGAGLSTDSGIPDYRGPGSPPRQPLTYQEFVSGPEARQRYWAPRPLGFGRMRHADPNDGHRALAALDPDLLITQNVDGLHEAAGSRRLGALRGRVARRRRARRGRARARPLLGGGGRGEPVPARGTHDAGQPRLRCGQRR